MIPLESVAVASCLAILLTGCYPSPPAIGSDEQLRVTHVADGDTVTGLDAAGQRVRVRLLGIDAPEVAHAGKPGECGASDARSALERLVLDQLVTLADDPRADRLDRYGRRLAYVDLAASTSPCASWRRVTPPSGIRAASRVPHATRATCTPSRPRARPVPAPGPAAVELAGESVGLRWHHLGYEYE